MNSKKVTLARASLLGAKLVSLLVEMFITVHKNVRKKLGFETKWIASWDVVEFSSRKRVFKRFALDDLSTPFRAALDYESILWKY